jgi:hypothetical protein
MEMLVPVCPKHIFHYAIIKRGIDHVVMNVGKTEELNHL